MRCDCTYCQGEAERQRRHRKGAGERGRGNGEASARGGSGSGAARGGPAGLRFGVRAERGSGGFPAAPGALRRRQQETSFAGLLRITGYVGHGDRPCAVWGTACGRSVGALRQEKPV